MKEMMLVYDGDQHRYAQIAETVSYSGRGNGKRICHMKSMSFLLICGTKDHAGFMHKRYNREWHRNENSFKKWIERAGHNSNTDKPEMINSLIEEIPFKHIKTIENNWSTVIKGNKQIGISRRIII